MHGDLAAAAQRQSRGSHDDGLREVAHPHVHVLQAAHSPVERVPHALLRRDDDHEQIRARAEVVRFVADHESVEVLFHAVERLADDVRNVLVEGVHLGVELHQRRAVADVEERRARVVGDHLLRAAEILQNDHARGPFDLHIFFLRHIVHADLLAVLVLIERLDARLEHRVHPLRGGIARGLHPFDRVAHAEHVPRLERPRLVHEAPAHGVVNRLGGVGHFGDDGRRVLERLESQRGDEFRGAVVRFQHDLEAVSEILEVFRLPDGFEARLRRRDVFHRLQVERPEFLLPVLRADFLVEADFALVAEPAAFHHRVDEFVRRFGLQIFHRQFVVLDQRREIFPDVLPNVHAHEVNQAERRRARIADQRTRDRVHFVHGIAVLQDEIHPERARPEGDAVADEVGRVLAKHNAFAETNFAEPRDELRHFLRSVRRRDDLQQFQIARRIKEVRAEEMLFEALRASRGDVLDGDARSIRRDNTRRLADFVNARHQILFDLQVLDDDLDNPVRFRHRVEIVLQVSERDQRLQAGVHQVGGLRLQAAIPQLGDDLVARRLVSFWRVLRDDVEQGHAHARVGEVRRDRRAHRPCADDDGFVDLVVHVQISSLGCWGGPACPPPCANRADT
ncbi:MAG: hypothetical protein PGMFKBFP_00600 [Anaerolineales bacterium]|nr:hypothetical protein [Anaerolineales bacterium]